MGVPFPHAGWVAPDNGLEEGEFQFTPPTMARRENAGMGQALSGPAPMGPRIPGLNAPLNVGTSEQVPTFSPGAVVQIQGDPGSFIPLPAPSRLSGVDLDTGVAYLDGNRVELSAVALNDIKKRIAIEIAQQLRAAADQLMGQYDPVPSDERPEGAVQERSPGGHEDVREVRGEVSEG